MAFDGNIWIKLRRPLSDWEKNQHLKVDAPASKGARPGHSVFDINDIFLEMSDVMFLERGVITWGGPWLLAGAFLLVHFCIFAFTTPPRGVHGGELVFAYAFVACFSVFSLALLAFILWLLHLENFTWTRRPVRFYRQTRMVHAYRGAGSREVISVAWEKAHFFIEKRPRDAIVRAIPYVLRCHVLDERSNVVQSFSIGPRLLSFDDETTEAGAATIERLRERLEFIRRYMEGGPTAVVVDEFLPTTTSFAAARWIATCDDKILIDQGNGDMVKRTAPLGYLQSVCAWLSWKTCREPVWPEAIQESQKPGTFVASATKVGSEKNLREQI
ncbi:DUF6708 domain-containing protein [Paraburkholderia sp. EG287A]|uniref:DUF6708 domain-containing protein n=1 Tax=unclassified Paraburkholderia TaxID=2615204 RepID=UPI0034D1B59C